MGRGRRKSAVLPRGKHEKRAQRLGSSAKWAEGEERVLSCPRASMKREYEASKAVQNGQEEEKKCHSAHEQV